MNCVEPLFFLHKDAIPNPVRRGNELSNYEVCMSAARRIDEEQIEGAQKVGGLWKV